MPLSVQAATTWDMSSTCSNQCDLAGPADSYAYPSVGNAPEWSSGGVTMSATGWSTAPSTSSSATFDAARLVNWGSTSGWGVVDTDESVSTTGPHATDNVVGTDFIALSFTQAVSLTSFKVGWNGNDSPTGTYNDSDVSVLAYNGAGSPTPYIQGQTIAQMLSVGWSLVGNYSNVGGPTDNTATISTTTSSSWWLISAYNASYCSATQNSSNVAGCGTSTWTSANDAFKLLAVAGTPSTGCTTNCGGGSVPEPGGLALVGLGFVGMIASRRKVKLAA